MLKMKKILAALSVAVLACNTLGSISANAGTACMQARRSAELYKNAWQRTAYYRTPNQLEGIMVFGYDTFWIDEDYVETTGEHTSTRAGIRRMYNGDDAEAHYTWTGYKQQTKTAKLQRDHECNWVRFSIQFDEFFDDLSVNVDDTTSTAGNYSIATPTAELQ